MNRPVYVYRLAVKYPEGVDWRNPPKGWVPLVISGPEGDEPQPFSWPTRRHYMSRGGARTRADLLRGWGCTVTIERSEPVAWPAVCRNCGQPAVWDYDPFVAEVHPEDDPAAALCDACFQDRKDDV